MICACYNLSKGQEGGACLTGSTLFQACVLPACVCASCSVYVKERPGKGGSGGGKRDNKIEQNRLKVGRRETDRESEFQFK